MADVCPTITAKNPHIYREQYERVYPFAKRIHFDLANESLAPSQLIAPSQLYWDDDVIADIHIMYKNPATELETLISLRPHMVILHAEIESDLHACIDKLHAVDIKVGIALLQQTAVEAIIEYIPTVDHVLIFSGNFGHFGGKVDTSLFPKISAIKKINPTIEIGWDGGVAPENAKMLVEAGVDVLNVGGYIQHAQDAAAAYKKFSVALQ